VQYLGLAVSRSSIAAILCGVAVAGCAAETGAATSPTYPPPAQRLDRISGDLQEGTPGIMLANQLVVRLTNPSGAVAGVPVTWRVLTGAGVFLPSASTITDANGEAQVSFTPETHRTTVIATINMAAVTPVEFRTIPRGASYSRVSAPATCYGSCERFVLYVDGTFALRYSHVEFLGTFTRQDSILALAFSADAGWVATGILRSDTLFVTYNTRMSLSDFEDALFLRTPGMTSAARP
jgi:hypothetical protein